MGVFRGEARGGANRVVIGVLDMGEMDVPVVLVFHYRPWLKFKP